MPTRIPRMAPFAARIRFTGMRIGNLRSIKTATRSWSCPGPPAAPRSSRRRWRRLTPGDGSLLVALRFASTMGGNLDQAGADGRRKILRAYPGPVLQAVGSQKVLEGLPDGWPGVLDGWQRHKLQ